MPDQTRNILLNGAKGRMGQAILQAITTTNNPKLAITAPLDQGDDPRPHLPTTHIIIDYSHHTATPALARHAAEHHIPLIIGTTGHTPEERRQILESTHGKIPLVWASNYSIGVTLLNHLVKIAATTLDPTYQVELLEIHHRHKKDAPSGTAETLLNILRTARALPPESLRHGRTGHTGERPGAEIGVHALRGGDIVGEHTILFLGEGERLELTHKATDRHIFATGTLRAAQWILTQPPGLYDMESVLGLAQNHPA
ncbi:MAG: 4-hydroxy-tetrahydrodipicolinate reductase [Puniceicoccales bacterium]|jgi:4-hydroxy-tetrahydrodipicolinate reductase|nr:4-hydroxy-tetrahydrodipicolinate reductase [Puniceicoccales bacterium]